MSIRTASNYAHLAIDIPIRTAEALSAKARAAGMSRSELIRNLLAAFGDTND